MANIIVTVNGSTSVADTTKGYRISEAHLQQMLDATRKAFPVIPPGPSVPPYTNEQLILLWIQEWINRTITGTQRNNTVMPPPITID